MKRKSLEKTNDKLDKHYIERARSIRMVSGDTEDSRRPIVATIPLITRNINDLGKE